MVLAPLARADTDTQFLADIDGIGVPESPAQLIASAHKMCSLYANGASEDQVNCAGVTLKGHLLCGPARFTGMAEYTSQTISQAYTSQHGWREPRLRGVRR